MTAIIKLKDAFLEEKKLEKAGITHNYLDDYDRQYYELSCKNGLFYQAYGQVADGRYLFVRLKNGKLYGAKVDSIESISHHSYLSGGKAVTSVGYLNINKGKLERVSNESGHYKPMNEEMYDDLIYFFFVAKNPKLVYEDHSRFAKEKFLYRYYISDIMRRMDFSIVTPIEKVKDANSNYHRLLKANLHSLWKDLDRTDKNASHVKKPGYRSENDLVSVGVASRTSTNDSHLAGDEDGDIVSVYEEDINLAELVKNRM